MHIHLILLPLLLTTTISDNIEMSGIIAARRVLKSPLYAMAFKGDRNTSNAFRDKVDTLSSAIMRTIEDDNDLLGKRVLDYYVPVALWLESQIRQGKKMKEQKGAVCVGFSLPQGAGKTTLAESMTNALEEIGYRVAVVSYDDFYLTREDQVSLQQLHEGNPYVVMICFSYSILARIHSNDRYMFGRGVAGTHDIALGSDVLDLMINASNKIKKIYVPRYDKTRHDGQGDRMPQEKWHIAQGPLDLVILEGWMLGFGMHEHDRDSIRNQFPGMEIVHDYIKQYEYWISKLDAALIAGVEDIKIVYEWREQAEKKNRDRGLGAMSVEEVIFFCNRYMPSYYTYAPKLYAHGIPGISPDRTLQFMLNAEREPVISACPADMEL